MRRSSPVSIPAALGKDPKTRLQEWLQARRIAVPEYAVTAVDGRGARADVHDRMPDSRAGHRGERQRTEPPRGRAGRGRAGVRDGDRRARRRSRWLTAWPPTAFRCGYVAIVGRPNVGKSTLLNHLVGAKVSITSRKAQTTRHRVTGILTTADAQFVFVDTPGFQTKHRSRLNERMNRAVTQSLADVDAAILVVEAGRTTEADRAVIRLLPAGVGVVVALNKIDRLEGPRSRCCRRWPSSRRCIRSPRSCR